MSTVACVTTPAASRARARPWRRPPPVSTTSVPSAPRPSRAATHASVRMPLPLISAIAAVGVVEEHLGVGAVVAGLHDDQAVGADAGVAVAERARLVVGDRVSRRVRTEPRPHEEVVAGGVQLGQPDGSHALQLASRAGRTVHAFSGAPNQLMRGSRRNHMRWRRANWRVRTDGGFERRVEDRCSRRGGRGPRGTRWPARRCGRARRDRAGRGPRRPGRRRAWRRRARRCGR